MRQGLSDTVGEPGNRRLVGGLAIENYAGSTQVTQRNLSLVEIAAPRGSSCARKGGGIW